MAPVHFYMDESVPIAIAEGLGRRGVSVVSARDAGNLGLTDANQLQYAIQQQAAIFTHDDDFLVMAIQSSYQHFGVIYVHQQKYPVGECIRRLKRLAQTTAQSVLRNRVIFL